MRLQVSSLNWIASTQSLIDAGPAQFIMVSNERIILWPHLIFGLIDELDEKCFFILDPNRAEELPHPNMQFAF